MRSCFTSLLVLLLFCFAHAQAAELLDYDFQSGDTLADYPAIEVSDLNAEIVTDTTQGKCLKLSKDKPSKHCNLKINHPFTFEEDLVLSFDVKTQLLEGKRLQNIAIGLYGEGGCKYYGSKINTKGFQYVEFPFYQLKPLDEKAGVGTQIHSVSIDVPGYGDVLAEVYLDNIKIGKRMPVQRTDTNPPFFNWKPQGPVVLEYSRDANFSKDVTKTETETNFHTPQKFLTPGKWYWRVCKDGACGMTRCMVVPEKTHQFLCPPIDQDFVLSKPRPWLVEVKSLTKEERAGLREEYDLICQWKVPEDPPVYDAKRWPDRYQYYSQISRRTVLPTGKRLQRLAEIYAQLKDKDVKETLCQWVDKIIAWDPDGGSSPKQGDISSYHVLRGLNHAYDALHDSLPEAKKKPLRDRIIARAKAFEKMVGNPFPVDTHKEYNNHAWLQALVLCESGLVLLGDYEGAYAWAEYGKELLVGKFLCVLGYQGENNEGIAYASYGGMFLVDYAGLIRQVSGINLFKHPWLKRAGRFPLYCAPKNAWAVSFADTGTPNHFYNASKWSFLEETKNYKYPWIAKPVRKNTEIFCEKLSAECNDPYGMWYVRSYEHPTIAPKPPIDLQPSVHYDYIGWAILNTNLVDGRDGVTFAMHSGPYWGAHQHADQNAFVINAYGDKLAIDSGYYDFYGSEHFLKYAVRTQAHNAILVNGQGQPWRHAGADGKIARYFDSPFYGMTVGDASDPDIYEGQLDRWLRKVLFIKPNIIVIDDDLRAKTPADYEWLLHTVASIKIKDNTFDCATDHAVLKGVFLSPQNLSLSQTEGYPVLPEGLEDAKIKPEDVVKEWTLKATFQSKRKETRFITVLQIDRAESQTETMEVNPLQREKDQGIAFSISYKGMRHVVCLNETGAAISLSEADTDAKMMVLSFNAQDQLEKYAVYGGAYLKYQGKLLFETAEGAKVDLAYENCGDAGAVFDVAAFDDCTLSLLSDKKGSLLIDGQPKGRALNKIKLTKGRHTVSQGRAPQKLLGHPIKPLNLGGVSLSGYKTRSANQRNYYWWGRFTLKQPGQYAVQCSSPERSNNIRVYIDDDTVDPSGSKSIPLDKGIHFIQISSSSEIGSIKLLKQAGPQKEKPSP